LRHHLDVLFAQVTIRGPIIGPNMESTLILVTVRENEPFEKALRRFRRKVEREGIRKDIKKNSFYLKPGEKRRLKQRLAEKRRRKAMRRAYTRR
jgi:small subunit ribosomal protein S21